MRRNRHIPLGGPVEMGEVCGRASCAWRREAKVRASKALIMARCYEDLAVRERAIM